MRLLALAFAGLAFIGCSTYEIPQVEVQRISKHIEEGRLQRVSLDNLFPPDHKFPELYDHFFMIIYHLEKTGRNYVVNKQELQQFFEKHNLKSFFPFSELEEMIKEYGILKFYNDDVSEALPGPPLPVYFEASENIHFSTRTEGQNICLTPTRGTLRILPGFLIKLLGYSFESRIYELKLMDKGENIVFRTTVTHRSQTRYFDVIYHAATGKTDEHELSADEIKEVIKGK
ncbi:hypothetical protein KY325_05110 [Candidatus Woesearchaeota archaeon]|nr:hypothetical protein [Candidatus Woesearchaeota archaeon]MBW3018513.1 hypothetical protein [Candidatus Woesearchaeota archaeon]